MSNLENGKDMVLEMLRSKSTQKKALGANLVDVFARFRRILDEIEQEYLADLAKDELPPRFSSKDNSPLETQLIFGGDILYFTQHTNIFTFEQTHSIHQTDYVREDPSRAYCGMIQIHNFLYDSIHLNRRMDIGYLVGRIFINKDLHFFVEGKKQLGFLYNDFDGAELNDVYIRGIIEAAMVYAIDFDLLVPPYQKVAKVSVDQKNHQQSNQALATGKSMGFKFQDEQQTVKAFKEK
ncbi:MAG: hypothetical protein ACI959_001137 [Limisphaerales bacterium]|jgi:hypothetical protein